MKNFSTSGEISVDANGTSYIAGLIVPVPIIARPGNEACKELGGQIHGFITGQN